MPVTRQRSSLTRLAVNGEGLNQVRAVLRGGFKSDGERRSVAAKCRTKAHFRREDPFTVLRLAQRHRFGRVKSQRLSQPKETEGGKFAKIGLEQDERIAVWESRFE